MKRSKILATVVLTSLLGTTLFAATNDVIPQKPMKENAPCMMKMKGDNNKMMKGAHYNKEDRGVMGIFKELNLTADQETKMFEIRKEVREKYATSLEVVFTKDSFDKAKYLEIMKQKRDNMLESRAEILEKSYALLTPKQKEQFKVLVDLQQERKMMMLENMGQMGKGMKFDKNCNGGR